MGSIPSSRNWTFDSVHEFMHHAINDRCVNSGNAEYRSQGMNLSNGEDWYGFNQRRRDGQRRSHKDIERVVAEGWLEGAAMVCERIDQLEVPWVPSVRRRLTWTDQGDHLEMPKVWAGQIDTAWQKGMRRTAGGPRSIRIVVDNCYHAGRKPEDVQWRGIAAIAFAQALIDAGHIVELASAAAVDWYTDGNEGRGGGGKHRHMMVQVTTKPAMMPLDVANVAATTAFSGFFRGPILWFFWTKGQTECCGCGSVVKFEPKDVEAFGFHQQFVVPQETDSQDAAQAWVNKTAEEFINAY